MLAMAKTKTIYVCHDCGLEYAQWQGQCRGCRAWNAIEEMPTTQATRSDAHAWTKQAHAPVPLHDIKTETTSRLSTGLLEFDHVLGGGLVSDSVILIGGDPGIGKSTLLLQMLCQLSGQYSGLYVSGEESLSQISLRAQRLGLAHHALHILTDTSVASMIAWADQYAPQIMVVDSIQTAQTEQVSSPPGSVNQVRESAAQLVHFAKSRGIVLCLVGHVTKEGGLAGPRILEHMVDVVLYFEGRQDSRFRLIRAVKNRFGAVNEIGIFAMTSTGLKPVSNPSAIFLSHYSVPISGSVITVTWEGSRPLLVELQALVNDNQLSNPRRVTVGVEANRLSMILALLYRHGGAMTGHADVFVNVVGGLHVSETAADLPLLIAVLSSLRDRPMDSDLVIFGEVGLGGEIRPVPHGPDRLKSVIKHGFKRAIVPRANAPQASLPLEIMAVDHVQDALRLCGF